jgi:hypothetical protein
MMVRGISFRSPTSGRSNETADTATRSRRLRDEFEKPPAVSPPTCTECGRPWFDPKQWWRAFLDDEDEPRLYCPKHAEAEFGEA